MKTFFPRSGCFPVLLLLLIVLGASAVAQEATTNDANPNGRGSDQRGLRGRGAFGGRGGFGPSDYTVEVREGELHYRSQGGPPTVHELVKACQTLYPENNIVADPSVSDLTINDFKMRPSNMDDVLEAARIASGNLFQWQKMNEGFYTLLPTGVRSGGPARNEVRVFNLSAYFDSKNIRNAPEIEQTLNQIQEIIHQTLDMTEAHGSKLKTLYHPGTRLFVVSGNPDDLSAASAVIDALTGQTPDAFGRFRANFGVPVPNPVPISPPAATLPQRPPRQLEQPQLPPPATGVPEPAAPQPKVRF